MIDAKLDNANTAWARADQADRRGEVDTARSLYWAASQLYADVVCATAGDLELRRLRGTWAIAAISAAARAHMFNCAIELAERFLADTLPERVRDEIRSFLRTTRDKEEL